MCSRGRTLFLTNARHEARPEERATPWPALPVSDADGTITNVDWHIQHADGNEEVLTGTQATTIVPANQQVSITAVVTDNQGKEDFTTQVAPAS
ncbi:hypothetical protein AoKodu_25750 [Actinomyces oris K20]|uniref:hypothetical protein n=1 Tax=Actinomyces oris TaxID=544580 RepID=UPI0002003734|nr:hypothetical protein AoKodu_25750 [Actinomyces oris K20]